MTDIVLKLAVAAGEEDQLFGRYLNRFMEDCSGEADRTAANSDAPYMMIRSDPSEDAKILIFQERTAASAFSSGWAKARSGRAKRA